ncbi:MAG: hypothetical protein AB1609_11095 [Bacillota bacterium]
MIRLLNPWTGEAFEVDPANVTQSKLDAMAECMNDDIREQVHLELSPCTPGEFFARYVELAGAEAGGALWCS